MSWAVASGVVLVLLASNNCGFPEYAFHADAASGAGSANAGAPDGDPNGGSTADAGAPDAHGGGGTAAQAGAGEAGAAGAPGPECAYPEPLVYPKHCFDGTLGDGETGTDCGGAECSACAGTQTCVSGDDCLSGKCNADKTCMQIVTAEYTGIVGDAFVRSGKFKLTLTYQDSESTMLSLIRVRYYFNHNGVTEPILGLNSQAILTADNAQQNLKATQIHTQVYRTVLGPAAPNNGRRTDSYIEVTFNSPLTVRTGTKLEITQDFSASTSDELFDQNSHYSFFNGTNANETVLVYRGDKRIWGIEPPWVELPDCAYAGGVSLNGKALTVSGAALQASSEANLTFSGGGAYANAAAKALPTTDSTTTELLTTARNLTGAATANWAVPNGKYYAFAWVTSAASSDSGVLTIQNAPADKFVGMQMDSAAYWALLGPYVVTVSEQNLALAVDSGFIHLAGLKLYRAQ